VLQSTRNIGNQLSKLLALTKGRSHLPDMLLPREPPAFLKLLPDLHPMFLQPVEPGAALQIGAGAA